MLEEQRRASSRAENAMEGHRGVAGRSDARFANDGAAANAGGIGLGEHINNERRKCYIYSRINSTEETYISFAETLLPGRLLLVAGHELHYGVWGVNAQN